MVTLDNLKKFIKELAKVYEDKVQYLSDLDAAIGDADHGINLNRGFKKVVEQMDQTPPNTIDELLKMTSMQLIKTVGGASGPLLGTFYLKASLALKGVEVLDAPALVKLFKEGSQGIITLGKAELQDKTMVDTLLPALEAMEANQSLSIKEMMAEAKIAAEKGMQSTIDMIAKKGRASYLGERSKGHQDPGATSSYLMIELAAQLFE